MTLYRFSIVGTCLFSVYVPVESILEEKDMIYTRKKIRKFWIFFVEKSEILGGFYLKNRRFLDKKMSKFQKFFIGSIWPYIAFKSLEHVYVVFMYLQNQF